MQSRYNLKYLHVHLNERRSYDPDFEILLHLGSVSNNIDANWIMIGDSWGESRVEIVALHLVLKSAAVIIRTKQLDTSIELNQ